MRAGRSGGIEGEQDQEFPERRRRIRVHRSEDPSAILQRILRNVSDSRSCILEKVFCVGHDQ
jgi:hypothetical protein